MRLLRVGAPGKERPALLDAKGVVRDLSSVVTDISGTTLLPDSLAKIAKACGGNPEPLLKVRPFRFGLKCPLRRIHDGEDRRHHREHEH